MKRCSTCGVEKPLTEFTRDATRPDGYKYGCKVCRKVYHRKYVALNRERVLREQAEYRAANREKMRQLSQAWSRRNPEKVARAAVEWRERNRAHHNAEHAKRRAEKTQATPAWACRETIKDFYAEANYFQMHVDHIVPLKSALVCGLHWEGNMQLLEPSQNISKKNRWWPDMPVHEEHRP